MGIQRQNCGDLFLNVQPLSQLKPAFSISAAKQFCLGRREPTKSSTTMAHKYSMYLFHFHNLRLASDVATDPTPRQAPAVHLFACGETRAGQGPRSQDHYIHGRPNWDAHDTLDASAVNCGGRTGAMGVGPSSMDGLCLGTNRLLGSFMEMPLKSEKSRSCLHNPN